MPSSPTPSPLLISSRAFVSFMIHDRECQFSESSHYTRLNINGTCSCVVFGLPIMPLALYMIRFRFFFFSFLRFFYILFCFNYHLVLYLNLNFQFQFISLTFDSHVPLLNHKTNQQHYARLKRQSLC